MDMYEGDLHYQSKEDESKKIEQILALDVEQFPEFRQNVDFIWQRDGARLALKSLQDGLRRGYLKPADFLHVVDFGAGGGGPTYILDHICKMIGGSVTALERAGNQIKAFRQVVPDVALFTGDGLDELAHITEPASLITAFKLGPDHDGELFARLSHTASSSLVDIGKLLVFSDDKTMGNVAMRLLHSNVAEDQIKIIPEQQSHDTYQHIPITIILSKQGAAEVK